MFCIAYASRKVQWFSLAVLAFCTFAAWALFSGNFGRAGLPEFYIGAVLAIIAFDLVLEFFFMFVSMIVLVWLGLKRGS